MFHKIKTFLFENKTDKQTIAKNTIWLLLAELINKGSIFIVMVFIARILGPEEFGILSFIMSYVIMFLVITDFGMTTLLIRESVNSVEKLNRYIYNFSVLKIALGCLTLLIVLISLPLLGKEEFYTKLIIIYTLYSIINNIGEFLRSSFRAVQQMQSEALLKIISGIILMGVVGYSLLKGEGLDGILIGFLLSSFISLVITFLYTVKKLGVTKNLFDSSIIYKNIKSGLFLMGGMLFIGILSNIDKVMLGLYDYNYELGVYGALHRMTSIGSLVIGLFVLSSIPNILKSYNRKKIYNILRLIGFVGIGILLIGILFGNFIIHIVYGINYEGTMSYALFIILLVTLFFNGFNIFIYHYLNHIGIEKGIFYITIGMLILNVIGNYYLIPLYQGIGAAITTLALNIIMLGILCFYYSKDILKD